jgi:hypothetical protein
MNHAFGLSQDGGIVVLVSGWSEGRNLPILPIQVCRSTDDGRTWQRHMLDTAMVPFGPIVLAPDGSLTCAMYHPSPRQPSRLCVSRNGGEQWTPGHVFTGGPGCTSENALLRCCNGLWLAAVRTTAGKLILYRSVDDRLTWEGPVETPVPGFPGDLLELDDGRIILLAGQRDPGRRGIIGSVSSDQGESWSPYRTFIAVTGCGSDHGYPSSIQLPDGRIVTVYYWGGRAEEGKYGGRQDLPDSFGLPWHRPYHMGVMHWNADDVFGD